MRGMSRLAFEELVDSEPILPGTDAEVLEAETVPKADKLLKKMTVEEKVGQVIQGWNQGLQGVKVGSRVQLDIPADLMKRPVNEGFSGGEKKRNEIMQMAILEPELAILDETDSGLDIDALRIVAVGVGQDHDAFAGQRLDVLDEIRLREKPVGERGFHRR